MQFRQPEILYALLLIIIPIIVHLFQLQRFKKTPFTNVEFLKKLKFQTRKSSRLKKWLILLTRILAFTAIILAFSQPFLSNKKQHQKYTTTIYVDNSWSMQLKNQEGELLHNAVQQILKNIKQSTTFSLITNDEIFKDLDVKELKNKLLNIKYSTKKVDFNTVLLKNKQLASKQRNTINNLVLISDFQENTNINSLKSIKENIQISLVDIKNSNSLNISIDSLYITRKNNKEITLKIQLKNTNYSTDNLSVSLYNDTFLVGKTTTPISENKISEVEFTIPTKDNFKGIVKIEDENLTFDNTLFFTLSKPDKINVLAIGKKVDFLEKIYTKDEFDFKFKNLRNLNYNNIQNQNLIILNEIENIPSSLINTLKVYTENGGNLVVIPAKNSTIESYNKLLNQLNIGAISKQESKKLKITTLNFSHPLLSDVFEKKVKNFQYPSATFNYSLIATNATTIASFENEQAFLSEINTKKSTIYYFSSPLNKDMSNFSRSPLIVPIFYNFGKYSFKIPQLFYTIGTENTINLKATISKDEIVKIKNNSVDFIPLQQLFKNKIQITTDELPSASGFYNIVHKNKTLRTIAYNYDRSESDLTYVNVKELFKNIENISVNNSIKNTFEQLSKQQETKSLFKWFLILGIVLLFIEIFILKFFKI